jgi:O-antigen chain-terminating methyltransferase
MATKRKTRAKSSTAGQVVQEIHQQLVREDAAQLEPMLRRFELASQNRFRGSEDVVRRKLSDHLTQIVRFSPPRLSWVDLGCGRGEWLDVISAAGISIIGVDRNNFMIELCRNRGLPVVDSDALDYVRQLNDGSCAVVTAFHLLENCEFSYVLALLREAARVLSSGGLFVIETPNPENHRVAQYSFWLDPMHRRLLPRELMEFTCEHFGLRVAHSEGLNEDQEHGPQDYTIIAIR